MQDRFLVPLLLLTPQIALASAGDECETAVAITPGVTVDTRQK